MIQNNGSNTKPEKRIHFADSKGCVCQMSNVWAIHIHAGYPAAFLEKPWLLGSVSWTGAWRADEDNIHPPHYPVRLKTKLQE